MSEIIKFTLPGDPDYIKVTKSAVGSAASLAGFDYESIEDIQIAVAEACRNITCHGFAGWASSYDIICDINDNEFRIEITDNEDLHEVEKGVRPCTKCPQEGELGMCIVESIMDEVKIITEGNCRSIVMIKRK